MKRIWLLMLIMIFVLVLSGCSLLMREPTWPPVGWEQEEYGSFSPDVTYSYDRKYYAVQNLTKPEGYNVNVVLVTVYDFDTNMVVNSFLTERALDFWGICWESDSYNIWIQSSDVGTYCMIYQDGAWVRDEMNSLRMPDDMIDRFKMRHGDFEFVNIISDDQQYYARANALADKSTGKWIDGIEINRMMTDENVFFYPFNEEEQKGFNGFCWEPGTHNLWVRTGEDMILCLHESDDTWICDTTLSLPDSIVLSYNWDGSVKK